MDQDVAVNAKGRKLDQVIDGARFVFMRDGFEGASVDEIARVARVSKATLYSYFPDKRVLFLAVTRLECQAQAEALSALDDERDVASVLRAGARNFIAMLASNVGQQVFRICVAECDRFPELGRAFYASGPRRLHEQLVATLGKAVARGELAIDDVALAADQFAELCKAGFFPQMIFNGAGAPSEAEIDRVVEGAVAMFMARYAAR